MITALIFSLNSQVEKQDTFHCLPYCYSLDDKFLAIKAKMTALIFDLNASRVEKY